METERDVSHGNIWIQEKEQEQEVEADRCVADDGLKWIME
jgi:hypothetical protein